MRSHEPNRIVWQSSRRHHGPVWGDKADDVNRSIGGIDPMRCGDASLGPIPTFGKAFRTLLEALEGARPVVNAQSASAAPTGR